MRCDAKHTLCSAEGGDDSASQEGSDEGGDGTVGKDAAGKDKSRKSGTRKHKSLPVVEVTGVKQDVFERLVPGLDLMDDAAVTTALPRLVRRRLVACVPI